MRRSRSLNKNQPRDGRHNHLPTKPEHLNQRLPISKKPRERAVVQVVGNISRTLNPKLNVEGASKGGGTLRAWRVDKSVYYWIEGYDSTLDRPSKFPGAVQL